MLRFGLVQIARYSTTLDIVVDTIAVASESSFTHDCLERSENGL